MSEERSTWKTAITRIAPNEVRVRGYDIADLMGRASFGAAVYLLLRGELPGDDRIGRLMDAVLVSSMDHGVTPPSALAARTAASTGAPLSGSVASGILHINRHHGGAIENCAKQLGQLLAIAEERSAKLDDAAIALLDELKSQGARMAGFGHRIHTSDPRTARLFELAQEAGAAGRHVEAARAVERVFATRGKPLPINVDGAIAAVLADLGFEPEVMNGVFMIARSAGLVAHAIEEQTTQRPMRRIDPAQHEYSGPAAKRLKESADVPAAGS